MFSQMLGRTPDFIDSIAKGFSLVLGSSQTWETIGQVLALAALVIGALLIVFAVVALISAIWDRLS